MITRLVKLSISPDHIEAFIEAFNTHKESIRAFEGCNHLELLVEEMNTGIVFTYSMWSDLESIENYRNSDLFNGIWSNVKPMFNGKPEAWSTLSRFKA